MKVTNPLWKAGSMQKDVKDIEFLLIWAFRTQQVEHFVGSLQSWGMPTGSLGSSLLETMQLGARVDGGGAGARMLGARCPDDALTIYQAVMALPAEAWMLVIKHARSATQPEWFEEGPGRWVQPLDAEGKPKRIWRDPKHKRGDLGPAPMVLEGTSPALVEDARAQYRLWHTALCELVPMINPELEKFVATYPDCYAEPWLSAPLRKAI